MLQTETKKLQVEQQSLEFSDLVNLATHAEAQVPLHTAAEAPLSLLQHCLAVNAQAHVLHAHQHTAAAKVNHQTPLDVRDVFAKMQAILLLPANVCSAAYALSLQMKQAGSLFIPPDELTDPVTARRALVEYALCVKFVIAHLLSYSEDLFLGFDATSTYFNRNFLEIHVGGYNMLHKQLWIRPIAIVEFLPHDATTQTQLIINAIQQLNDLQQQINTKITKLYNFISMSSDNENLNKGALNGVITKLNQEQRRQYEEGKASGQEIVIPYRDLIEKGCSDHIINLISKEFHRRIAALGKKWDMEELLPPQASFSYPNRAAWLAMRTYKRCGTGSWKGAFQGFCERLGNSISLSKVFSTRYLNVDLQLRSLYRYHQYFQVRYKSMQHSDITQKNHDDCKSLFDPDIQFITQLCAQAATEFTYHS